jgi:hypothetical protein
MLHWRSSYSPLLVGFIVGLAFGSANLLVTWLDPLADDTPGALLLFYGPMFFIWAVASFRAAHRSGRFLSGVITGAIVAFATFVVYDLLIFVRVNLFLAELTARADWQYMMTRFRASDVESLRLFVNVDYVEGIPLKLAVSCTIGLMMGGAGGIVGTLTHRDAVATA